MNITKPTPRVIENIVSQHAEEAAFLWLLRDRAVRAPHYTLRDLVELDGRVEAHIDGLRVSGEYGYDLCLSEFREHGESGETFVAAVLALEAGAFEDFLSIVEVAEKTPDSQRGLASALGWVPRKYLRGVAKNLLNAESGFERKLGIIACALHRTDPGPVLSAAINDADDEVRIRSLRAAGELGRVDLIRDLSAVISDDNDDARFWAAWSSVLLGDRYTAQATLQDLIVSGSTTSRTALNVLYRSLPPDQARRSLREVAEAGLTRAAIIGVGASGNPRYLEWLMVQMNDPELARVAGESISMITGADLAYEDLDGDEPDGFKAGPNESPEDDDVDLDDDEDLPWPVATLITSWIEKSGKTFTPNQRYLFGLPVSPDNATTTLEDGFQRQRIAASIELALSSPKAVLFEHRAPAPRQLNSFGNVNTS